MVRRLIPDCLAALSLAAFSGHLLASPGNSAFWASNVSLTWLLLPLWFGWRSRTAHLGAMAGLAMTWACLLAYYLPPVLLVQGGNPYLLLRFGTRYLALGTLSGPVLGALGAWWRQHPVAVVPLGVVLLGIGERWAWQWRVGYVGAPRVFPVEAALACALAAAMIAWSLAARTAAPPRAWWSDEPHFDLPPDQVTWRGAELVGLRSLPARWVVRPIEQNP